MGRYQSAGKAQMPVQSERQPVSPTHTSPNMYMCVWVCARARALALGFVERGGWELANG